MSFCEPRPLSINYCINLFGFFGEKYGFASLMNFSLRLEFGGFVILRVIGVGSRFRLGMRS
jgi:hypothetical protein